MRSVAILGAGVAGLAAAWRLLQLRPDWKVDVYEAEPHPGGLAASWGGDKYLADFGPHRIFTELPEIERLLPELIADDEMLIVKRRSELLLRGHFYRYPVAAGELVRHMGPFKVAWFGASALAAKLHAGRDPRNFEEAMVDAFGRAAYKVLVEPYTRKVWKTAPPDLSAEIARVRVSAGGSGNLLRRMIGREKQGAPTALASFRYIRGGVQNLVRSLVRKVESAGGRVHLKQPVTLAGVTDSRMQLQPGDREMVDADYVISTIPINDLVSQLGEFVPDLIASEAVDSLPYLGMVLVGLTVNRPRFSPNSWLYFPEEQFIFNRAYEPKNFDPGMAPADRSMAVFEVTSLPRQAPWTLSDEDIISDTKRGAIRTGIVTAEEVGEIFAARLRHAYPLYRLGYENDLAAAFRYLKGFGRLISTGRQGLFNHNNMDHSMLMGMRAAEYVAEDSGSPANAWYADLKQFAHFRIVD
jgi:protoporphyrinogen oxidase